MKEERKKQTLGEGEGELVVAQKTNVVAGGKINVTISSEVEVVASGEGVASRNKLERKLRRDIDVSLRRLESCTLLSPSNNERERIKKTLVPLFSFFFLFLRGYSRGQQRRQSLQR